jgi:hypothetical protein
MKKKIYLFVLTAIFLQACASSSNVTTNFALQKRKYTKGWHIKELFTRYQNKENNESEIQVIAIKALENDLESSSFKSSKPEEKLIEVSNKIEVVEEKIEETKEDNQSTEKFDGFERDNLLTTSLKIKQQQPRLTIQKIDETVPIEEEKKANTFFRVFMIITLSVAVLTIIFSFFSLTAELSLGLGIWLILLNITSLILVIVLLLKRLFKNEKYKESKLFIALSELLLIVLSSLAWLCVLSFSGI